MFRRLLLPALGVLLPWAAPAAAQPERVAASYALADRIDRHLAERWATEKATPAPRTDDGNFLRRISLDLAGRIPTILEARDFHDDPRPDKRRLWVERFLNGDDYAPHFTNVWREYLLGSVGDANRRLPTAAFDAWLRQALKDNQGYDRVARQLVTEPRGNAGAGLFYDANERKPENLAASTSRLFLGLNLECAQCHSHPTERWTRNQFWEYAAFFANVRRGPLGLKVAQRPRPTLEIPNTNTVVEARFLDGTRPAWKEGVSAEDALADWLVSAKNPYFARATVNAVWAYFFGLGLVDPVGHMGDENPPSHPELLDELAREFAAHDFDLKYLIRALVSSRGYQLSSQATHPSQDEARLFARQAVRALSPEQLFDSIAQVTEFRDAAPRPQPRVQPFEALTPRQQFVNRFGGQLRRVDSTTTILQALFLMNGKFLRDATSLEQNVILTTVAEAASTDTARRVETLYLLVLTRKPRSEELARLVEYVDRGGATGSPKKALGDVLWALLNSPEFMLNH